MLAANGRLKVAIQKGGRLTAPSLALLRSCGFEIEYDERALYAPCRNHPMDLLALRDDDIPEFVQEGVAHLGIVGGNVVEEQAARVTPLQSLGFGRCRLMLAVPNAASIEQLEDLAGRRIATSHPRLLRRFMDQRGLECVVVPLRGGIELAPALDIADAICDLVSTGSTARRNGLRMLHEVLTSEAWLIARGACSDPEEHASAIAGLLARVRASLAARGRRYVMMNAPASDVDRITALIPALRSPTIVPLADDGLVAIHSVVDDENFWQVMEGLKEAGATDIVATSIETIIP